MATNSKKPTSAKAWKGKIDLAGVDLPLPSENVARVKRISPHALMGSDMIPDPLTGIIRKAINTGKGMRPTDTKKIAEDPKMLQSALELFDRVLVECVIEPEIEMPPPCDECGEYANKPQHEDKGHPGYHKYQEGDRSGDVLYADQVDMTDKVFIFNWALGGVKKLETFREQLSAGVADLSDGEDVPDEAV